MEKGKKVVLGSLMVAVLLIGVFAIFTQDVGIIINIGVISLFIVVTPLFLMKYAEFLWIKSAEEEFPNFVRDLAGLKRSGISLSEAVNMTVRNNYGKLTPEVQKFSNRLSWGIHFLRALEIFSKRFKSSKIITEILGILKESYVSGGNISMTLDSLSKDMVILKEIEKERKSVVRQHVMIMYGIFFMFVLISIAIINVLIPMMSQSQTTMGGTSPLMLSFTDPCKSFYIIFPCGYFEVLCTAFAVPSGIGCYYFALFFSVLITQAVFMGLIAGQLGEDSIVAGTKHSLIMLASIFIIFMFLIKVGMLPVA
ncbi:MAG: type II secretion system F family protein [Candidatus Aenigmarchaeota archaeon]